MKNIVLFLSIVAITLTSACAVAPKAPQNEGQWGYGLSQAAAGWGQPTIGRYGESAQYIRQTGQGICPGHDDGGLCVTRLDAVSAQAEYACAFRDGPVAIFSPAAVPLMADADAINGIDAVPYLCVPISSGQVYFEDVEAGQKVSLVFLRYSKSDDHLVAAARCTYTGSTFKDVHTAKAGGRCSYKRT